MNMAGMGMPFLCRDGGKLYIGTLTRAWLFYIEMGIALLYMNMDMGIEFIHRNRNGSSIYVQGYEHVFFYIEMGMALLFINMGMVI